MPAQQAIGILVKFRCEVGAANPAHKSSGKAGGAPRGFIHHGMFEAFFTIVIGRRLYLRFKGLERANDRLSHQSNRLV